MLYYAIVFLPLIGFLVAGLFGNKIGAKASEYITSGLMVFVAILSWIVFFKIPLGHDAETVRIPVLHWVNSGALTFDWALRVDTLTGVMLVVVNSVSALVHIYSIGYMHHDPHRPRFFAYLSLFTFAMLMLVTSDNLIQMFFGWEGVGLASYLLIGFWFKKPSANAAAMKAFVVNRVGDFGFLLGIFSVFALFQSVDYNTIFAAAANALLGGDANQVVLDFLGYQLDRQGAITIACLLLFMGAMGKSAQFLLHTWLPDAMEGPTPVSALIHAATMVTAGVFMVARMSPIFELSQTALLVVTIIGATTAFFAATVALVQNDIKRVIAYSTCSQLGYMFAALGVGAYGAAVFHLFTHAFFKALLFLCAGSVIHAVSDEQDMRRMGGLRKLIPVTYWMMIISTVAITGLGIPGTVIGTAGFFSKDAIIEAVFASHNLASGYASTLLIVAALFTSFYSWRLIFMTFFGKPRASAEVMHHVHESPPVMLVPLLILGIGAILAGVLFKELFFGHEYVEFWKSSLFTSTANQLLEEHHHVPLWVKLSPFVAMVIGFVVAWIFYIRAPEMPKALAARHRGLYQFLLNKWYFDELYDFLFVRPARWLGRLFWKGGDGWLIDGFGPNGVSARVLDVTNRVVKMQSGYLYHYAFAMLIGVAALVTWMMLGSSF
ncbi:NADH-quinone oxidoreductase subunit L [Brucella neotomae]|uniref:NADH-ubiquinone oxidoreductase chain 5 n=1 Tax=Brucella neotomae 5K33 TaxID=520456 RepID=A0A7U8K9G4_BRUNE|nr:NADH-quinone oxidoreductase subunit L [Brucella neotomae]EEY04402.1 proton-translocating NADH-quinone oxidoreductase [Brucella neotomae 5K33]KEX96750.1 NADH:ubiquinone oxidoreductase subunit L [Brucella neotomae 5K33]KFJ58677.1 proton-translocating NADH-quinone oxidoreductase, chain L family protein [Brucella neotomae 5K33]SPU66107.1 NADH dehydrogenase I subunit L [Brucella neotomae]SPU66229.1 NADH dehydrogenase I subunit L [Brucella neotomae]